MNYRIFHRFGLASALFLLSLVSSTAFAQNNANANSYSAVNQAGSTSNVNVVNTPAVTVTNPVTVVEPAKEPVTISYGITFDDGSSSGSSTSYFIPSGKRLVLEQFSLQCHMPSPTYVYGFIDAFLPQGIAFPVSLAPSLMSWPIDGQSAYRAVGTVPIHWIQDSSALKFIGERGGTVGSGYCNATASGYLTPLPQ